MTTTDDIRRQYPDAVARGEARAAEAIAVGEAARAAEDFPEPDVTYRPDQIPEPDRDEPEPDERPPLRAAPHADTGDIPEWFRQRFADRLP